MKPVVIYWAYLDGAVAQHLFPSRKPLLDYFSNILFSPVLLALDAPQVFELSEFFAHGNVAVQSKLLDVGCDLAQSWSRS